MSSLTTKQKTIIVLEGDLGLKAFSSPSEAGNAEDLAKQVAASANQQSNSEGKYVCATQRSLPVPNKPNDHHRIWLGMDNEIPRWARGSVVNYTVSDSGWPSYQHAQLVLNDLIAATNEWNSHQVGVSFNYVGNFEDAAFTAVYGGYKGNVYADAFFPNSKDLNFINVYDFSFTPNELWKLKAVFLHELGHVLGLRHEFAATESLTVVEFGSSNPLSVMSYTNPPVIQASDIISTRAFYNWTSPWIGRYPIRDYYPDN
jgi:Met-zincin